MVEQVGCGKGRGYGLGQDGESRQRRLDQAARAWAEEGIRQGTIMPL
jgi:hypothetical protein